MDIDSHENTLQSRGNDTAVESASNLAIESRPYGINIIIKYVKWLSTKPFVVHSFSQKIHGYTFDFSRKVVMSFAAMSQNMTSK